MATKADRRILHITADTLSNVNPTQIGFERQMDDYCDLISYFNGGFGGKDESGTISRFARFNEMNFFKNIYMTDDIGAGFNVGSPCSSTEATYDIITLSHRNEIRKSTGYEFNSIYGVVPIIRDRKSINIGVGAGIVSDSNGFHNINIGTEAGFMKDAGAGIDNIRLGTFAGRNQAGTSTICIGQDSGTDSIGSSSIFIGLHSGMNTTGSQNTFIGHESGESYNGSDSICIGHQSGAYCNGGALNTFVGDFAGASSSSCVSSVGISYHALQGATGTGNIGIGVGAFESGSGAYNIISGHYTGNGLSGSDNIILGHASGSGYDGDNLIALGSDAGSSSSGDENIFIGKGSGFQTNGTNNIFIGSYSGEVLTGINNSIFIGSNTKVEGGGHNHIPYGSDKLFQIGVGGLVLMTGDFVTGRLNIEKTLSLTPLAATGVISTPYSGDMIFDDSDSQLKYYNGSTWVGLGGTGSTFTSLTDTPANYTGKSNSVLTVNAAQTGLELNGTLNATSSFVWTRGVGFSVRNSSNQEVFTVNGSTGVVDVTNVSSGKFISTSNGYELGSLYASGKRIRITGDANVGVSVYSDQSSTPHKFYRYNGSSDIQVMNITDKGLVNAPESDVNIIDSFGNNNTLITKAWAEAKFGRLGVYTNTSTASTTITPNFALGDYHRVTSTATASVTLTIPSNMDTTGDACVIIYNKPANGYNVQVSDGVTTVEMIPSTESGSFMVSMTKLPDGWAISQASKLLID